MFDRIPDKPYFRVSEVAELTDYCRDTLYMHIQTGRLKAKRMPFQYRIARGDLLCFLQREEQWKAIVLDKSGYRVEEVASILDVDKRTVYNYLRQGRLWFDGQLISRKSLKKMIEET